MNEDEEPMTDPEAGGTDQDDEEPIIKQGGAPTGEREAGRRRA